MPCTEAEQQKRHIDAVNKQCGEQRIELLVGLLHPFWCIWQQSIVHSEERAAGAAQALQKESAALSLETERLTQQLQLFESDVKSKQHAQQLSRQACEAHLLNPLLAGEAALSVPEAILKICRKEFATHLQEQHSVFEEYKKFYQHQADTDAYSDSGA